MREWIFAALLAVAACMVTAGAWRVASSAGLAVGGVLLALWSWMALADGGGE